LVINGLGVIYVLVSVVYLFLIYFFNVVDASNGALSLSLAASAPLILAVCILFGGFLGMLDDWIDLRWRYKAFLPLIAAIPLSSFAYALGLRTAVTIPFVGTIDFGVYYYFIIIPVLVTIFTNTVNQLGGLNGLETICPAIVLVGLMAMSISNASLLFAPLIVWLLLGAMNFIGRIFVGNTGSFAIGMTLASFAIISDLKFDLIISLLPYIFNSCLILLSFFFYRKKAALSFDGKKLFSDHRRSLVTVLTYNNPLTERQVVVLTSFLVAVTTILSIVFQHLVRN
jgi:UDP-N-acetylmuramyl pentapeptide phosphotransferase/UDP-N-acetylglucosamine-1-phosphate transferase